MMLEEFSRALDRLRPEIESPYPLTLGAIAPSNLSGEDGWRADFTVMGVVEKAIGQGAAE